ncbi:UNVERIFIED_CONTAM: hypothetical protein Sindi_1735000 [Sesamum indicum]
MEYEWLPSKCTHYATLGHSKTSCPIAKPPPTKPVHVYVPKLRAEPPLLLHLNHQCDRGRRSGSLRSQIAKVLRVTTPNTRIQTQLLSRWKWFVDYTGSGTRIWMAWDDDWANCEVLDVGPQHIHCRILIRLLNIHMLFNIVCGANNLGVRRELWRDIGRLAQGIDEFPWLVSGDLTLSSSEVCGNSGDIRLAMADFLECLHDTGLLNLPMQGERFTWHNCSNDSRSF